MAEGDSVFRMARRIEAGFEDHTILTAEAPNPRSPLRNLAGRLVGLKLEKAASRGKHLILELSGGLAIHSHMGMSGGWYVHREGEAWRRHRRAAWLVMGLGDRGVVQFGGPTLRLVRVAELNRDSRLAQLGPDLLDPAFTPTIGARTLAAAGEVELGEALLDQTIVSGIGNIFKSESCFEAGLDPWRTVDSFSPEDLERLMSIAQRQMLRGAETGRRPGRVYRKAGKPCPRCRHRIQSRGQGLDNRTTYWCRSCQA